VCRSGRLVVPWWHLCLLFLILFVSPLYSERFQISQ
jgi:hypothetical protein